MKVRRRREKQNKEDTKSHSNVLSVFAWEDEGWPGLSNVFCDSYSRISIAAEGFLK